MRDAIHNALKPVRSRQQGVFVLGCGVAGLAAGGLGVAALAGVNTGFGLYLSWAVGAALLAAGPVVGVVVGLAVRRSLYGAAVAVDSHYAMKDRAVTALAFAEEAEPTDLHGLQLADAAEHLKTVRSAVVVPLKAPRAWPLAAGGLIAACVALAFGFPARPVEAGPATAPDHIAAVGEEARDLAAKLNKKIADASADLEDEKSEDQKKGLKELLEKQAQKAEELTQPGANEREALAKLSEMMAEREQLARELHPEIMDGQLSSLGAALTAAQAFEGAGKALQEGNLEKAAKELEKMDEPKITPKEAKALQEKLAQMKKQMGEAGAGAMSDAVAELADALAGGNGKVGRATKSLAKNVSNAAKRKKIRDLLLNSLEDLKEAKGACNCNNSGGTKGKKPEKSNSPSSNWGKSTSGNIEGEKTKLGGKRNEMQITGAPGEGDSDVETTATPEAREKAARAYKEKVDKFKKESDAVLESEPLPLSHRAMIKKYFEMIRPQVGESVEKPAEEAKK